jgi:hypothetical protein
VSAASPYSHWELITVSLKMNQVTLTGSAQTFMLVPPGVNSLVISNTSASNPVYIGTGVGVSSANGFAIPAGAPPVAIPGYPGSGPTQLYVIGTTSDVVTWMLSTPN